MKKLDDGSIVLTPDEQKLIRGNLDEVLAGLSDDCFASEREWLKQIERFLYL